MRLTIFQAAVMHGGGNFVATALSRRWSRAGLDGGGERIGALQLQLRLADAGDDLEAAVRHGGRQILS
jgi:hypothetical protein